MEALMYSGHLCSASMKVKSLPHPNPSPEGRRALNPLPPGEGRVREGVVVPWRLIEALGF
jgi:hypothetical protein